MNPATLKMALSAASSVRDRIKDYREEKAREAYDLLSDAAASIDVEELKKRSTSFVDESRREAGNVTQAARIRLEKALEDLDSRRDEAEKKTRKGIAKAKKNLPAQKKAAAKRRKGWTIAGLVALTASVAAGAYYWFLQRQSQPGDTPPRVEDFSAPSAEETQESTLVYSTVTPTEETPAERDEELLGPLEEQLEKHRAAAMDEAGEAGEKEEEEEK
ncbi:hypothetical protein HCH15_02565 [Corynebacterium testudinoris]|uniref:hypothetical protein n=1 Tax=Corynebacterium testudinoris TaxID=136857 RepID=UPI001C8BDE23|nr:hypothetical protein [Corynebacterium testudinoris]MBX8995068.1 hypothetical protein [Corynebacterium testudinoris]